VTTLITGAGVIGCHTARLLAARGEASVLLDWHPAHEAIATIVQHPLVSVERGDVSDLDALDALVRRHGITRIVHTAALLSTAIRQDPVAGVRVNVMGTTHLLELARRHGMRRLVLASSTTVGYTAFADHAGGAFPEDFALRSLSHRPGSIYAATKVRGEHLALLYRDLQQVPVVVLRYAAVISAWPGPGTSVPGRVLSSLVGPARRGERAVIGDPYLLWQGGEEFIDARDCARANLAALDATDPQQGVYNIGLGELHRFDDFVAAVRQLHPTLDLMLETQPAGGFAGFPHVRTAASDISAAARELRWTPAYGPDASVQHFAPLLA